MLSTAALTLLALLAAALLALAGAGTPAAVAHLAFAVGIVPLILAAMTHFVPVLTRTGDPSAAIRRLPFFAQFAGLTAVLGLQGWLPYHIVYAAAAVDFVLAAILLRWIVRRASATLGKPHPGWRWYAGALALLMLALLAILATAVLPAEWVAWRRLHLHLNTLGLVGLAAFGTLPVLLPTALGQADPEAAGWLKRRFWSMFLAVVLLATGAAFYWPVSVAGAAILLVLALGLVAQWLRRFGPRPLLADGAACALLAAVTGWSLCLLAGTLHAAGLIPARPTLSAWAAAFLLPLVTGALSQLLPVWRWPGARTPERDAMRRQLVAGGSWRALAFLAAGVAFIADQGTPGAAFLLAGMVIFASSLLRAMRISRSTR